MNDPASPVGRERLVSLDFVRGVAVLGILYANIVAFAEPMIATVWVGALSTPMNAGAEAVWFAQQLLIDGRMRGLFSLLFGAGLVLFVDRARAAERGTGLQLRRLAWLAVFGLAHYFLLFRGDILFSYAFCGLIALIAVDWSRRAQLLAGLGLYTMGALIWMLMLGPDALQERNVLSACPDLAMCSAHVAVDDYVERVNGILQVAESEATIMGAGNLADILGYNFVDHAWGPVEGAWLALLETLPLMLLGMALYRYGLFAGTLSRSAQVRWSLIGIALGMSAALPLTLWVAAAKYPPFLSYFVIIGPAQLARLPMILGLAGLLAALAPRAARSWLGSRLVAAGRMAFSNYLATSLVMAAIFQGWGLGWFGRFDRAELLAFVVAGWLAMLAWSRPWLDRFRFGPLEWLWRCLTYGRRFPLRR